MTPAARGHAMLVWFRRESWRFGAAALTVAVGAFVAEMLSRDYGVTRLSMVFLASVVLVAVWHGAYVAVFSAILAFLTYNFFLTDPRFTLQFAGAEDLLTLVVFLAVALVTGALAGRVRDEGLRARARAQTAAALFQASREMSATADEDVLRGRLAARVAEAADGEAHVLHEGRHWRAPSGAALPPEGLEAIIAGSDPADGRNGDWQVRRLMVDGGDLGLAVWRQGDRHRTIAGEDPLVPVLIDLAASAIARARSSAERAEIETLARTERLRAALLSSMSHDFRTPLSSILASVSSLREFGDRFARETRDDLLSTIEEETERLNRFVVNLLNMGKLEGGALAVQTSAMDPAEIADTVLARTRRQAGARTLVSRPVETSVLAAGDPVLFEQALANVVDNAIRYTPADAEIAVSVTPGEGGSVTVHVEDAGPGVAAGETVRIFEKFYRSPATASVQGGAGLGLSITRGLVESMGGTVDAGPRRDGAPGLRVSLNLPPWQA